ncbi:hypothetical protein BOW53_01405 [Solemya pervernicosa gill symbiont]|uniref:Transcriptional regulator n=2 Tax=Gammaproteobacteria incertae sedis TaxID=118884 RepID=A0A1T2LA96_9GAMM|nr:MucB/RseB C-terminal domain-containing protein [Candidatus Reidiella endopervernicosa]OOZ42023.1 hypothetical protein BOW53_01405 [Solemya pervernicosa gill symbiont]QKQ27035.1 MucB/RseB C-terminal domain-containing protein [Candidatus Reidiella endopervernicosa]
MFNRTLTILIGWLLLWNVAAVSGADAQMLLEKMRTAMENLSYEGDFVFKQGDHLEPMHILHQGSADGGGERLTTLSGVHSEIVRRGGGRQCIYTGGRKPKVDVAGDSHTPSTHLLPYAAFGSIEQLSRNYSIELLGQDRMAGRMADVIAIEPPDKLRYGYRLWLDAERALLLNFMVLDNEGEPIEQLMFTSLKLMDKVPEAWLKSEACRLRQADSKSVEVQQEHGAAGLWESRALPSGFELTLNQQRSSRQVEHLVYSDGLATVSVFIEQAGEAHLPDGSHAMGGSVNAFSRFVEPHQIVAVGEVPAATVKLIAESIQQKSTD